jgi:hypothetical protein
MKKGKMSDLHFAYLAYETTLEALLEAERAWEDVNEIHAAREAHEHAKRALKSAEKVNDGDGDKSKSVQHG